jgi:hypothetical protein
MKMKQGFIGAGIIGLVAGVLRVIQYIFTIDREGYYKAGALPGLLSGMLVGLLAAGLVWSLLCGAAQKKELVLCESLFTASRPAPICFAAIGIFAFFEGLMRLLTAFNGLLTLAAVVMMAGGICWVALAFIPRRLPALLGLLPVAQMGASVLLYFAETYKYIQVSEYALGILTLCLHCLLTLLIMKARAGAECTKKRLAGVACAVLVFSFAATLAPIARLHTFNWNEICSTLRSITFILLAAETLKQLILVPAPLPAETPDLSELDKYISNIPDVNEEENNNEN